MLYQSHSCRHIFLTHLTEFFIVQGLVAALNIAFNYISFFSSHLNWAVSIIDFGLLSIQDILYVFIWLYEDCMVVPIL